MADTINEIVGKQAFEQIDRLTTGLTDLERTIVRINGNSLKFEGLVKGANDFKGLSDAQGRLIQTTNGLAVAVADYKAINESLAAQLAAYTGSVKTNAEAKVKQYIPKCSYTCYPNLL